MSDERGNAGVPSGRGLCECCPVPGIPAAEPVARSQGNQDGPADNREGPVADQANQRTAGLDQEEHSNREQEQICNQIGDRRCSFSKVRPDSRDGNAGAQRDENRLDHKPWPRPVLPTPADKSSLRPLTRARFGRKGAVSGSPTPVEKGE